MSLIDNMAEHFYIMNKRIVSDGEGGTVTTWEQGTSILASVTTDTSLKGQVGDAIKNTATYTVVVEKSITLDFYDVIKRMSDGQVYRLTSGSKDGEFPSVASPILDKYKKFSAEKWELTT